MRRLRVAGRSSSCCPDELAGLLHPRLHRGGLSGQRDPDALRERLQVRPQRVRQQPRERDLPDPLRERAGAEQRLLRLARHRAVGGRLGERSRHRQRALREPDGLEITVANDVLATHNHIHDNTVGVGLYHPNAAGNPPLPVMANWVIAHNYIHDNNLPNPAPPGTFQAGLPPGFGVLLLGVSDHVVAKNYVAGQRLRRDRRPGLVYGRVPGRSEPQLHQRPAASRILPRTTTSSP